LDLGEGTGTLLKIIVILEECNVYWQECEEQFGWDVCHI